MFKTYCAKIMADKPFMGWTTANTLTVIGMAVVALTAYGDVNSKNAVQDEKITRLEATVQSALRDQVDTNRRIEKTLSDIEKKIAVIEANSNNVNAKISQIEKKL